MLKKRIQITLTDANGKSKSFAIRAGRNGLVTSPISTERGFGQSQTDSAEIDGFIVSGDVWRFFEGTLGLESLYEELTNNQHISDDLLDDFTECFQNASDDEFALVQWNELVSENNALK